MSWAKWPPVSTGLFVCVSSNVTRVFGGREFRVKPVCLEIRSCAASQVRSGSVKVRATACSQQGTPNQRFLSIMRGRLSADAETFKEDVVRSVLGIPGMNQVVGSKLDLKDLVVELTWGRLQPVM